MSLSSQPQASEAIVEKRRDALGNEVFIGTELLNRFFDDLAQITNTESVNLVRVEGEIENIRSESGGRIQAISDFLDSVASMASLVHSIQADIGAIKASLSEITDKLSGLDSSSAISAADNGQLRTKLSEIDARLSNVEQACL